MKKIKIVLSLILTLLVFNVEGQAVDDFLRSNTDLKKAKGEWLARIQLHGQADTFQYDYYLLEILGDILIFSKKRKLRFTNKSIRDELVVLLTKDIDKIEFLNIAERKTKRKTSLAFGVILGSAIGLGLGTSASSIGSGFAAISIGPTAGLLGGILVGLTIEGFSVLVEFEDSQYYSESESPIHTYLMKRKYKPGKSK